MIKLYETNEINKDILVSYKEAFNLTFKKDFSEIYFLKKYRGNYLKKSFHAFLEIDGKIHAGCSIIPCQYEVRAKTLNAGIIVDTFIEINSRKDPFLLHRMYKSILEKYQEYFDFTYAIPNENAHQYWVKINKHIQIGELNIYVFPNLIPRFLKSVLLNLTSNFSKNIKQKQEVKVRMKINDEYIKGKFNGNHKEINIDKYIVNYNIYLEKGLRILYIQNLNYNDLANCLVQSMRTLIKEKVDLIVFIGKIRTFQFNLLKLPKFIKPKKLPITIHILSQDLKASEIESLINFNSWEFSLLNFDVR